MPCTSNKSLDNTLPKHQYADFLHKDHRDQWSLLDALLVQSRALWQVKAFDCTRLPWEAAYPLLAEKVWSIRDEDIDEIDGVQKVLNAELLPALSQDLLNASTHASNSTNTSASDTGSVLGALGLIDQVEALSTVSYSTVTTSDSTALASGEATLSVPAHFSAGIKGRKWQQIVAFAEQIKPQNVEVLEWCAGKGHLGRLIAKAHSRPVVSLEWQQSLCDAGSQFAEKWQLPQRFICADAFAAQQSQLKPLQQVVALHACGDLHVHLLQLAAKANTQSIAISPCCYHLIQAKQYQALSKLAQNSVLKLSRHDLQMPLQQSAIASAKQKTYRYREIAWRLGFDSLQRDVNKKDCYLPIPSVKQSQLNLDFETFCYWAAEQKSVTIPKETNFDNYLALGVQRQRLTQRIDLVAHLFRGVLEQWLLLDRVCYLQEQGYRVELNKFCSETVTPRNSLIVAEKNTK